jgi:hypothetical protein
MRPWPTKGCCAIGEKFFVDIPIRRNVEGNIRDPWLINISPMSFGAIILILTETSYEVMAQFKNIQARALKTASNGEAYEIQLQIFSTVVDM